jgi:hypothetical protein
MSRKNTKMRTILFISLIFTSHLFAQGTDLNPLELIKSVRNSTQFQKYLLTKGCVLTEIINDSTLYSVFVSNQLREEGGFYYKRPTAVASDTIYSNLIYIENLNELKCEGSKRTEYVYAWKYNESSGRAFGWINYVVLSDINCYLPEKVFRSYYSLELTYSTTELYQSFLNELMKSTKYLDSREVDGKISQVFEYIDPTTKKKCEIWCTKQLNKEGGEFGIFWVDYI